MKMNWPNRLVILRFFMAFIVIGLLISIPYTSQNKYLYTGKIHMFNYICLGLFIVASITDWLDGWLARRNDQVTIFGKIFDPLADKVLVNSVLVIMAIQMRMPMWIPVLFIIRDLAVDGLRMHATSQGKIIAAGKFGKIKTVLQMISISILFIWFPENGETFAYHDIMHAAVSPMYLALMASLFSGFQYYKISFREVFNG